MRHEDILSSQGFELYDEEVVDIHDFNIFIKDLNKRVEKARDLLEIAIESKDTDDFIKVANTLDELYHDTYVC